MPAEPYHDFPLAPKDRVWDKYTVVPHLRKWASKDGSGEKDQIDWDKYKKVFLWHEEGKLEDFGQFKFPYCDIINGEPHVVYNAIRNILSRVGNSHIPEEDKEKVRRVAERHLKRFQQETSSTRNIVLQTRNISLNESNDQYMTLDMVVCSSDVNLNGVRFTEEFINNYKDTLVDMPVVVDREMLESKEWESLTHLFDGENLRTDAIGVITETWTDRDEQGFLVMYARAKIWKRFKSACKALIELYSEGLLNFSCEVLVDDWKLDDNFIEEVYSGKFLGHCIVSFPAELRAKAVALVAEKIKKEESELDELKARIAELEALLASKDEEIASLKAKIAELEGEIEKKNEEIANLGVKINELNAEVARLLPFEAQVNEIKAQKEQEEKERLIKEAREFALKVVSEEELASEKFASLFEIEGKTVDEVKANIKTLKAQIAEIVVSEVNNDEKFIIKPRIDMGSSDLKDEMLSSVE